MDHQVTSANRGNQAEMVTKVVEVVEESREETGPLASQASTANPDRSDSVVLMAGEEGEARGENRANLDPRANAEFRAMTAVLDHSENKDKRASGEKLATAEDPDFLGREDRRALRVSQDPAGPTVCRELQVRMEQQEIVVNVEIPDCLETRARMELLDLQVPLDRMGKMVNKVNRGYEVPMARKESKAHKENAVILECWDPAGTMAHTVLVARRGSLAMAASMAAIHIVASTKAMVTGTTTMLIIKLTSRYWKISRRPLNISTKTTTTTMRAIAASTCVQSLAVSVTYSVRRTPTLDDLYQL